MNKIKFYIFIVFSFQLYAFTSQVEIFSHKSQKINSKKIENKILSLSKKNNLFKKINQKIESIFKNKIHQSIVFKK